nr:hypothetical protein [Pseudoclavibacter alba]
MQLDGESCKFTSRFGVGGIPLGTGGFESGGKCEASSAAFVIKHAFQVIGSDLEILNYSDDIREVTISSRRPVLVGLVERADLVREMVLDGNDWYQRQVVECLVDDDRRETNVIDRLRDVTPLSDVELEVLELEVAEECGELHLYGTASVAVFVTPIMFEDVANREAERVSDVGGE